MEVTQAGHGPPGLFMPTGYKAAGARVRSSIAGVAVSCEMTLTSITSGYMAFQASDETTSAGRCLVVLRSVKGKGDAESGLPDGGLE